MLPGKSSIESIVLTNDELWQLAAKHVREFYHDDRVPVLTDELQEPPGLYFGRSPSDSLQQTGDGGFFVARSDGKITHFGEGEIIAALMRRVEQSLPQNRPGVLPEAAMRAALRAAISDVLKDRVSLRASASLPIGATTERAVPRQSQFLPVPDDSGCRVTLQEHPDYGRVLHVVLAANQTAESWKHVRSTLEETVERARPQCTLIDLRDLERPYGVSLIGVLVVGADAMRKLGADRRTRIVALGRVAESVISTIRVAGFDMLFGGTVHPDSESALRS